MTKRDCLGMLAMLLAPVGTVIAEWPPAGIEADLGLTSTVGNGVEIRVWLGGVTRVAEFYRIVKTDKAVSVDHIMWTTVIHPSTSGYSEKEAHRETTYNRRILEKERCAGKLVETPDYLWCKIEVQARGPWPVIFEDLLQDELWNLPQQTKKACDPWVILDGEAVTIDIFERERHHSVSYWNPDICCGTVACAIVNHVRHVVRDKIY